MNSSPMPGVQKINALESLSLASSSPRSCQTALPAIRLRWPPAASYTLEIELQVTDESELENGVHELYGPGPKQ